MSHRRALLTLVLSAGTAASVAHAQSWLAPVDGNWFDPAKWSGATVPTGAGATGTLGLSGPYTVVTTSNSLLGVNITNPAAVLAIAPNNGLTLGAAANQLNGVLVVNQNAAYAGTSLSMGASAVSFSGSGSILLNASTSDGGTTSNTAAIVSSGGGSLTMNPGTRLEGFGILNNTASTNNGTFTANIAGRPLRIEGQTHQNNALYTAANTGVLVINGATINQSGSGSMAPGADSAVSLNSSTVNGGSLTSSATGRVQASSGTVTFNGVAVNGGVDENANMTVLVGPAGLTLNGGATFLVNTPGAYAGTTFRTGSPATPINGTGTIRLNASTSDGATTSNTAAIMEDGGDALGSFVFAPGVTVAGFGIVNSVPTTNNGTFNADVNGRYLRVEGATHQNNGLYTATNGGVLLVSGTAVTQAPGASMAAAGAGDNPSSVVLSNASVTNGWLVSNGAAHVSLSGSSSGTLTGVTLSGQFDQSASSNLYIDAPGITLSSGSMLLVNAGGNYAGTQLRSGEAVTIGGSGVVRLNASTSDGVTTANTAALTEDGGPAGGQFTFAPTITVAGFGIINNVPTINDGVVNADVSGRPLRIDGNAHQNHNLYTSANGGTLWLSSTTVNQSGAGRILAGNGSAVVLTGSHIVGGAVGSPAGGTGASSLDNSSSTLDGVTVSRQLSVDPNGQLTTNGLTLSNSAVLTVNTAGGYAGTRMLADAAPTVIGGTGTVHLNASTSDGSTTAGTADLSRNGGVAGSGFTFGPGVTVDGFGRINTCPTTNNGLIDANTAGRPLRIDGESHQNNGTYRASNTGVLDIANGAVITQSASGLVLAADGSGVYLNSCTLTGGSLSSAGSGRMTVVNPSTVHDLASNAPLDVNGNQVLVVSGPIVNNGTITVNTAASYAGTALRSGGAGVAVNGNGRIVLNRSTSDGSGTAGTADLGATGAGNSWVLGAGQTLAGTGRITAPVLLAGVVSPGVSAGEVAFIRNDSTLTLTNTGRLHMDLASASSYDTLVNAGTVNLSGSLEVAAAQDFAPGTTFDVIQGAHSGEFAAVVSSGLASPKRFGARYDNAGRVRVTVLCGPADIAGTGADGNGDGVLDNNDFVVFIDRFFTQDPRADYGSTGGVLGADGQFNNNDFVVFIDLFFAGCF